MTTQTPTTHLPPNLSPDSIDTLTELTAILTRLRASQTASASSTIPPPAAGSVTGTTPLPSSSLQSGTFGVKELPAATDNLKHKLQRARAAVRTLPDVARSVEQQERDIAELEARRREQLAMLARIKAVGLEQSKGEDGERMID
ncbi:RNA polymerase II transcription mediator complex subunit 9-domain-containing protein [Podospora aff. communis PSN243]|uniref:Mediator of RNA polymerase II transcription subunit 9 n=1 Tax=Podospora aff. communis PSN243 TaxID=3040156 RepID=A0AAV9GGX7_9PEZI|nr:RNA polymerase II transcription mediator complex subunit 9-domain-containing protein [Podospora aff. communis PSN243]